MQSSATATATTSTPTFDSEIKPILSVLCEQLKKLGMIPPEFGGDKIKELLIHSTTALATNTVTPELTKSLADTMPLLGYETSASLQASIMNLYDKIIPPYPSIAVMPNSCFVRSGTDTHYELGTGTRTITTLELAEIALRKAEHKSEVVAWDIGGGVGNAVKQLSLSYGIKGYCITAPSPDINPDIRGC